jgi:hypothetical protein
MCGAVYGDPSEQEQSWGGWARFSLQPIFSHGLQPASQLPHGSSLVLTSIDSCQDCFPPVLLAAKTALEPAVCWSGVPRCEGAIVASQARVASGHKTGKVFPNRQIIMI